MIKHDIDELILQAQEDILDKIMYTYVDKLCHPIASLISFS